MWERGVERGLGVGRAVTQVYSRRILRVVSRENTPFNSHIHKKYLGYKGKIIKNDTVKDKGAICGPTSTCESESTPGQMVRVGLHKNTLTKS